MFAARKRPGVQAERTQGPNKVKTPPVLSLLLGQLETVGTDLLRSLLAVASIKEAEERSKGISQLGLDAVEPLDHAGSEQDALHGLQLHVSPSSQPVPLAEELVGLLVLLRVS